MEFLEQFFTPRIYGLYGLNNQMALNAPISDVLEVTRDTDRSEYATHSSSAGTVTTAALLVALYVVFELSSIESAIKILDSRQDMSSALTSLLLLGGTHYLLSTHAKDHVIQKRIKEMGVLGAEFEKEISETRDFVKSEHDFLRKKFRYVIYLMIFFTILASGVMIFGASRNGEAEEPPSSAEIYDDILRELDREALRSQPTVRRADLYHVPESLASADSGTYLGFFPDMWYNRQAGEEAEPYLPFPESKITYVEEISAETYSPQPDEWVYSPFRSTARSSNIFPPVGYYIAQIFVESEREIVPLTNEATGMQLFLPGPGNLALASNVTTSPEVLVVARPDRGHTIAPAIIEYLGTYGSRYTPNSGIFSSAFETLEEREALAELYEVLASAPEIMSMHQEVHNQLEQLYQDWRTSQGTSSPMTVTEYHDRYSEIVQSSLIELVNFIQSEHFYSLLYEHPDIATRYPILAGYGYNSIYGLPAFYCTIANQIVDDFFAPFDVRVYMQTGSHYAQYGNGLYSRVGHLNGVMHLPNGHFLYFDATPYTPNPGEDLSMLEMRPPSNAEGSPVDLVASSGLFAAALIVRTVAKRRKTEKEVKKEIREDFSGVLATPTVRKILEHIFDMLSDTVQPEKLQKLIQSSYITDLSHIHAVLAKTAATLASGKIEDTRESSILSAEECKNTLLALLGEKTATSPYSILHSEEYPEAVTAFKGQLTTVLQKLDTHLVQRSIQLEEKIEQIQSEKEALLDIQPLTLEDYQRILHLNSTLESSTYSLENLYATAQASKLIQSVL